MKLLELFSGTQSVGKVCKDLNIDVISLDINDYKKKFIPTHLTNILDFDYKQYPKDTFDMIWASPPCVFYSILTYCKKGQIVKHAFTGEKYLVCDKTIEENRKLSDKLVLKTLEIIDYFKPKYYFIENPAHSDLKNRGILDNINNYIVDYCCYANWGYKKSTRIWTNKRNFNNLKCSKSNCLLKQKHINLSSVKKVKGLTNKETRYRIPYNLIKELLID